MNNSIRTDILTNEDVGQGGVLPIFDYCLIFGIFNDAKMDIEKLKVRQQELKDGVQDIIDAAGEEDLTPEQLEQINANVDEAEQIGKQISAKERVAALTQGTGRKTNPDDTTTKSNPTNRVPAQPRPDPRTFGFKHLGEFANIVRHSAMRDEGATQRLLNMNEGVGEDGGFLVPPEFRDGIMKVVEGEESLLSLCDMSQTSRNSVVQNYDDTTPWGTAGIQVYWEGEGQSTTTTGAKVSQTTLRLNKLFARVDVSDELLEDAPQLDSFLRQKTPEVMTSVINLALISGNGVGKPLGFMNSPALVTVAAETSQPADTIHHRNLVKMMARMYSPSWPRSRFLINPDVWPQIHLMSFRDVGQRSVADLTAAVSPVPAYMPPSTLIAGAPFGTLLGRPVMPLQGMETLGDLGDIALVDMSMYRAITKTGGVRVETSIHLKFDTDEMAYRFIFRLAGAPWWQRAISPRDGSNTMSCFVTLASR